MAADQWALLGSNQRTLQCEGHWPPRRAFAGCGSRTACPCPVWVLISRLVSPFLTVSWCPVDAAWSRDQPLSTRRCATPLCVAGVTVEGYISQEASTYGARTRRRAVIDPGQADTSARVMVGDLGCLDRNSEPHADLSPTTAADGLRHYDGPQPNRSVHGPLRRHQRTKTGGIRVRRSSRVVQPAAHGPHVSTGNPVLRAYQVGGTGNTREVPFWDLYLVAKIRNFRMLDERFDEDPPGYRRGDKHIRVHCQL